MKATKALKATHPKEGLEAGTKADAEAARAATQKTVFMVVVNSVVHRIVRCNVDEIALRPPHERHWATIVSKNTYVRARSSLRIQWSCFYQAM